MNESPAPSEQLIEARYIYEWQMPVNIEDMEILLIHRVRDFHPDSAIENEKYVMPNF